MPAQTWVGANGSWSIASNWSPYGVPTATVDALIDTAVAVAVTAPSAAHSVTLINARASVDVASLLTVGTTFAVDAGTLTVSNGGNVSGRIAVSSGAQVTLDSGGSGSVDLSSILASRLDTGGSIVAAAGSRLTIVTDNTGTLTAGQLAFDASSAGLFRNGATTTLLVETLVSNANGTLAIGSGPTWTVGSAGILSGGGISLNSGTLTDDGVIDLANGGVLTINGGVLAGSGGSVTGGKVVFERGLIAPGNLSFSSVVFEGELALAGGTLRLLDGTRVLALNGGAGTVTVSGGTLSTDAATTLAGDVILVEGVGVIAAGTLAPSRITVTSGSLAASAIQGGTVDLLGGSLSASALQNGVLNLSGGELTAALFGPAEVIRQIGSGGTITGGDGTALDNEGTIAASGGGTLTVDSSLTNSGTVTTANGTLITISGGVLTNATGGLIDISGGQLIVAANVDNQTSSLTNDQGATLDVGSGALLSAYYGTNAGLVDLASGSSAVLGSSLFSGTVGSKGGVIRASSGAAVTVLTNANETLATFKADLAAVRADLGRADFDLQVGLVLNLSSSDTLTVGSNGLEKVFVVDGSLLPKNVQPAVAVYGGNTDVAAGGTLVLDNGNFYSQTSNSAEISLQTGSGFVAEGSDDAVAGNLFSNGTLSVTAGSTLSVTGNFVNGTHGSGLAVTVLQNSSSLFIDDSAIDSASANGIFYLNSGSNLYLANYADLTNQEVQFTSGTSEHVSFLDAPALAAEHGLQGSFFGLSSSDVINLPFTIGSITYNSNTGFVSLSNTHAGSYGATFFVGTGYNASLFTGAGTQAFSYDGAPPAVPHHV